MNNQNRAIAPIVMVLVIILVIAGIIAAIAVFGAPATTQSGPVTVYIDNTIIAGNYSEPQTLTWTDAQTDWSYSKNFTVENNINQNLTVTLLTASPAGATLSWTGNNTILAESSIITAPLTVNHYQPGVYTWILATTNSTITEPPIEEPEENETTPPPQTLNFTIHSAEGMQNVTFTIASGTPITIQPETLPQTFSFTSGSSLTFRTAPTLDYTFNYWQLPFEPYYTSSNPVALSNVNESFVISAHFYLTPVT